MKIFFVTSKLNFETSGGSIEEFDLMIRTWQKMGHEVVAVTAFSDGNKMPDKLPYKVIEEQISTPHLLGIQWGIYKVLKKYESEADIFHIDGHMMLYGAGLYRLLGGKVPVVGFFNFYLSCWEQYASSLFPQPQVGFIKILKNKLRWLVERSLGMFLANQINAGAFISPPFMKMYQDFGLKLKHNFVMGDPIDFKKIMSEQGIDEEYYVRRNKKVGPFTIFYSSRMSPGKGFDILLTGFAKVKNKDNFRLILGGSGPEEKYVKKMIENLGLAKYVHLPGWVSKQQIYDFYKQADIFIQADWWPMGTSISLIYALIFGVPSILPGGGGLEWNAQGGGLSFKTRDTDDLALKIEKLGSDFALRVELSRGAYARLHENQMNFEWQIGEWLKIMAEVEKVNRRVELDKR